MMSKENLFAKIPPFSILAFLFFIIPFLFVFCFDALVGRTYLSTNTDTVQGFFGLGLNCLTGTPKLLMHHPGYFFHELSGIAIGLIGLPVFDLHIFAVTGIIINLFFLLFASLWVGYIHHKFGGNVWMYLMIGFVSASMPTTILASHLWTLNFPMIILSAPACLHFFYILRSKNLSSVNLFFPLAVLGFIVGNLFIGAIFVLGAFVSLLVYIKNHEGLLTLNEPQLIKSKIKKLAYWLFFPTSFLFFFSLMFAIFSSCITITNTSWKLFFTSLVISALTGLIETFIFRNFINKHTKLKAMSLLFFTPILFGWLIAVNVMSPFYFLSAVNAFTSKGGAVQVDQSFNTKLANIDFIGFLNHTPWHFIIFIIFILSGFYFVRSLFFRSYRDQIILTVFCFVPILLNFLIAWDTFSAPVGAVAWFGIENFGQISRYFMLMPASASVLLVYIFGINKKMATIFVFILLFISSLTIYQFVGPFASYVFQRNFAITNLNNYFNSASLNHKVICLRTLLPEYCSLLYSFNNYRSAQSLSRLHQQENKNGNIVYLSPLEYSDQQSFAKDILAKKPDFVVAEKSENVNFLKSVGGIKWALVDPLLNIQIWTFNNIGKK